MNRSLDRTGKLAAQTPEGNREMKKRLAAIKEMYAEEEAPRGHLQAPTLSGADLLLRLHEPHHWSTADAPCPNNTVAEPKDEEKHDDYQGRW